MKILFIAPRFHTNQFDLIQKLIKEKNFVDFFVIGKGISESYNNLYPKQIPISRYTKWYVNIFNENIDFSHYANIAIPKVFRFWEMVKKFNPDVIILRGASAPMYSKILIPYAIIRRIKIIFYTQGAKYVGRNSLLRKLHDFLFVNILKIRWFTPVLYRGTNTGNLIDLSYIDYIPFFINPQVSEKKMVQTPETINFLCVAKYEDRKNIKLLIESFLQISKEYKNFKLTIIGSTGNKIREKYFDDVEKMVADENLSNHIFTLKNVPFNKMKDYYLISHVMVLPSIKESASISQLEAMSYGLAVICSKDNGSAHYVKHSSNGFIIDATLENLKDAIEYYIQHPEKTVLHGNESLNLVNTEFSIKESYSKLMLVIKEK